MSDIEIGPQDFCVQCGLDKSEIRNSQQYKDPIPCEAVYEDGFYGEWTHGYPRHKFIWTAKDQARAERETLARDFAWLDSL